MSHASVGKVIGVCPTCGESFIRDVDSLTVSLSYARVGAPNPDADPRKARSYPQWVASAGNYCDKCMPPIPKPVVQDMVREQQLRTADREQFKISTSFVQVPNHIPNRAFSKYNGREDEPKKGKVLGNDGIDVRTPEFRERNVRQETRQPDGRPVHIGGGVSQGEAVKGRSVVRRKVLSGNLQRRPARTSGPYGETDQGVDLCVRGTVRD